MKPGLRTADQQSRITETFRASSVQDPELNELAVLGFFNDRVCVRRMKLHSEVFANRPREMCIGSAPEVQRDKTG